MKLHPESCSRVCNAKAAYTSVDSDYIMFKRSRSLGIFLASEHKLHSHAIDLLRPLWGDTKSSETGRVNKHYRNNSN